VPRRTSLRGNDAAFRGSSIPRMGFLIGRAGTVCNPHRDALRMTRKPQAAIHLWRCSAPHLATRRGRVRASACGQVAGARQWL